MACSRMRRINDTKAWLCTGRDSAIELRGHGAKASTSLYLAEAAGRPRRTVRDNVSQMKALEVLLLPQQQYKRLARLKLCQSSARWSCRMRGTGLTVTGA